MMEVYTYYKAYLRKNKKKYKFGLPCLRIHNKINANSLLPQNNSNCRWLATDKTSSNTLSQSLGRVDHIKKYYIYIVV